MSAVKMARNHLDKDFNILWSGNFKSDALKTLEVQNHLMRREASEEVIEEGWQIKSAVAAAKNFPFFNGPLARFEGFESGSCGLSLQLSTGIFYRDVVGLRAKNLSAKDLGIQRQCDPNAFSIFNILITSDNKIPFGLRKSGDWDESLELSGGFLRVDELDSLEESSLNRLREDFAIERQDLIDQNAISLYEHPNIFETTLIFVCKTNLSSTDFKRKTKYEEITFFENSVEGLAQVEKLSSHIHSPSLLALQIFNSQKTH